MTNDKQAKQNKFALQSYHRLKLNPQWWTQKQAYTQQYWQENKHKYSKRHLKLRFEVLNRDNFTCRYCGRKAPEVILHIDHITPKSEGGTNALENLATACEECNLGKSNLLLNDK